MTATTTVPNPPDGMPRVLPHVIYDDVRAAVAWLTDVCEFRERTEVRHTDADGRISRTQMHVLDSMITVGTPSMHGSSPSAGVSSMLLVYVDDVDAHHERAAERGARIVSEPRTHAWGDRSYQLTDPEGHQWTFARHVEDVAPDACGH